MMFSNETWGGVLFEGNLGQLVDLGIVDNRVLEVRGVNGVLRVDLCLEDLESLVARVRSGKTSSSELGSIRNSNTGMK